jgi:hypothetical protein
MKQVYARLLPDAEFRENRIENGLNIHPARNLSERAQRHPQVFAGEFCGTFIARAQNASARFLNQHAMPHARQRWRFFLRQCSGNSRADRGVELSDASAL